MGWQDDPVVSDASSKPSWSSDPIVGDLKTSEKPEVGGLEAFGRGAAQAFGLGYSPQLIAAAKTGHLPGSEDAAYMAELKKQKAATEQAWEQHPWLYGSGMVASAIPAAAGAVLGAPEAAAASTLGSLGGAGLRALAGEGAGMLPSALRGAAGIAENPIVQGAIFGSSEGETLPEKATGAAAGAIGAKVAPAVLGAVGSGVKSVGQKIAPDIVDPIFHALTGNPKTATTAANIASDIGVSLPSATISESGVLRAAVGADVFNQVPKAANQTLNEIGSKIADYAGNANRNDAGEAIRNAVQKWTYDDKNPSGFRYLMDQVYQPIRKLEASTYVHQPSSLMQTISRELNSPKGRVSDITPTLNIARIPSQLADENGGLTFAELKAFREVLSDNISWNQVPGASGLNNAILQRMRDAVTRDMQQYARAIGGKPLENEFSKVNRNAQNLYSLRDNVYSMVGNPDVAGAGAKTNDAIYRRIIGAAAKKGGANISDLDNLYNTVVKYDPDAWASIGRTYASELAPNGQFLFANFHKGFDGYFDPRGKALIFGPQVDGSPRQLFENINALGRVDAKGVPLGRKLDDFGSKVGNYPIKPAIGAAEIAAGLAENAMFGGIPLGTVGLGSLGAAAGRIGAQDVAAPASTYVPSAAAQIAGETIKGSAPILGAELANKTPLPGVIGAAVPYVVKKITNQLPPSIYGSHGLSAAESRYGRKSGGRVTTSDALVAMADRAKKSINNETQSLLNTPDTHVAQALEIANRNLEG